jgi:ribosome maturation factor RimP
LIEAKIKDLLEQKFQEEDFSNCFLVDLNQTGSKLEVFIDSDTGINFDTCRKISRYLEGFIDEEGWLGEKYTLDVSSPGATRPLKLARQYPKHVGRKLEVKTTEGLKHEGQLVAVDDNSITLSAKVRVKEGKKKRTEVVETQILFNDIEKAKVKISFNNK